jgi:hypothetical protein
MKRAWVVLALVIAAGCSKGPSKGDCKKLLDHLVDLAFKKAGAAASSDAMKPEIAKQKTAVSEAKASEFLATCTKKTSRSRVLCALNANSLDGDNSVAKCDEAK